MHCRWNSGPPEVGSLNLMANAASSLAVSRNPCSGHARHRSRGHLSLANKSSFTLRPVKRCPKASYSYTLKVQRAALWSTLANSVRSPNILKCPQSWPQHSDVDHARQNPLHVLSRSPQHAKEQKVPYRAAVSHFFGPAPL